ncbi:MAG: nucleotidyltransferase [Lentisphaeria bacterium]|nr:nucleotidyltransferase [Lentisphaeria bacterium]
MTKPTLLVLDAGMGSRYGGLKQIDPVGPSGEIILDYSIFDALKSGFGKVVFIIRKDIEKEFRESVSSKWENKVAVEYAFQALDALPAPYKVPEGRVKPWGTGHAIMCAAPFIHEPFAAINADDFYGRSAYSVLAEAFGESAPENRHYMVGFELRRTLSEFGSVARGICVTDKENFLRTVTERTNIVPAPGGAAEFTDEAGNKVPLTGGEIASMNFWGFRPSIFDRLGALFEDFLGKKGTELKSEFYIPAAVASLISSGEASVKVLHSTDSWFGVTYRDDKARVQSSIKALVAQKIYPSPME